jgi:SAM-dependent methyltransferase
LWEFVYILQSLRTHGMLAAGRKGLGFGTGQEPLPAVMAKYGVQVLATDLDTAKASARGWVDTNQHASALADLNRLGICEPQRFAELVRFEFADMSAISPAYRDFDFCWSACALEHLGSIDEGLAFIENSLRCLKPGGVAVHTTEYNCGSDSRTLEHGGTVIFRMRDFLRLGASLRARGHDVSFNFHQGDREVDRHIDVPPYSGDVHLKLRLMRFVTTSIGITVRVK